MHVRAIASAAAFISLAFASSTPSFAEQQANSGLPAPVVLSIPRTYGGTAPAAARAPLPQLDGQQRAAVQAERYAAAMTFMKKYGPGKPVRLKVPVQRYR